MTPATRTSESDNWICLRRSRHDKIRFSFEEHLVQETAARLEFVSPVSQPDKLVVAREMIAIAIVLFGFVSINRKSKSPHDRFALKLAALLCVRDYRFFSSDAKNFLEQLSLDTSVQGLLGFSANVRSFNTLTAALKDLGDQLKTHITNGNKAGILDCSLPYLKIGNLTVSSRFEIESYQDIKERVETYKYSEGGAPLNIGVFGPAGSGKSFGVKEVFREAFGQDREFHEFNLSGIASPEDLGDLFLRLQETAMKGLMPIAFWDEFDTECGGKLGWLRHFLGPMQDGTFIHKGYARTLPRKVIFVFAGSMFGSFGEMALLDSVRTASLKSLCESSTGNVADAPWDQILDQACAFTPKDFAAAKGPDFKSRLDAVLDIRGVSPRNTKKFTDSLGRIWDVALHDTDSMTSRLFRKARILEFHLTSRYRQLRPEKGHLLISPETLSSLLFEEKYYHDARSIEKMVKMFGLQTRDVIDDTVVPTGTQRRIHMPIEAFD